MLAAAGVRLDGHDSAAQLPPESSNPKSHFSAANTGAFGEDAKNRIFKSQLNMVSLNKYKCNNDDFEIMRQIRVSLLVSTFNIFKYNPCNED